MLISRQVQDEYCFDDLFTLNCQAWLLAKKMRMSDADGRHRRYLYSLQLNEYWSCSVIGAVCWHLLTSPFLCLTFYSLLLETKIYAFPDPLYAQLMSMHQNILCYCYLLSAIGLWLHLSRQLWNDRFIHHQLFEYQGALADVNLLREHCGREYCKLLMNLFLLIVVLCSDTAEIVIVHLTKAS